MRDPKRINKILKLVGKIWCENPELRLLQLLGNCFSDDNYYIEDEDLELRLKEVYYKGK